MNPTDQAIAQQLITSACPSIQTRVLQEISGINPLDQEILIRQPLILQDDLIKKVMTWPGISAWLDKTFHGSQGIETAIRILVEKGVQYDHFLITSALGALEQDPLIIYRGIGAPGRILDDLGFGGSAIIRAVVRAQAGKTEGLDDQIHGALSAFRFVTNVTQMDEISRLFKGRLVFSPGMIWPSIYHLRLLAYTDSWRGSEELEMMARAVSRLTQLSPIPDIKVLWRSHWVAPASFAMLDFNPDLEQMSGAAWMAWFHRTELLSRIGLIRSVPALAHQFSQLNTILDAGEGWFTRKVSHSSFNAWGPYTGLSLEKDWRSERRRISDLTFRCLLIRKYTSM